MKKVADRFNIMKMKTEECKTYNEYMNKTLKERDYLVSGLRKQAIEIATEMLAEGDSIEKVMRITKLSIEEISRLLAKN